MKLAAMADLHVRGKDLDAFGRQIRKALGEVSERGISHVFMAGDVFDHPNITGSGRSVGDIVSVLKEALLSYTGRIAFHLIPGQHDKENETSRDALTVLEGIADVEVIRTPRTVYLNDAGDVIAVDCVPWIYAESSFETINNLRAVADSSKTFILCAHLQVRGARMNGGHVCSRGAFSVSSAQLLSLGYDRIWLGDFHARQDIANGSGGYIGALRQKSFAFVGQPQGFEVYDTATRVATFIEINEAPRHEILLWNKGDEKPTPTPGYNTRIKTVGWISTAADRLDSTEILYTAQTKKTDSRLDFDPTDAVLESPKALLDLYIEQKSVDVTDRSLLHELLSELIS